LRAVEDHIGSVGECCCGREGEDDSVFAGRPGDGDVPPLVIARTGVGIAVRVVPNSPRPAPKVIPSACR